MEIGDRLPVGVLWAILDDVPCEFCGEPVIWHILIGYGTPIGTADWHEVTRYKLKPSDVFGDVMQYIIPIQRQGSLQTHE